MKKLIIISGIASVFLFAGSAYASTQEDVALCRTAFFGKTGKSIDEFRLKFDYKKGKRVRTLRIIAVPNSSSAGASFQFDCTINRNTVTDISLDTKRA